MFLSSDLLFKNFTKIQKGNIWWVLIWYQALGLYICIIYSDISNWILSKVKQFVQVTNP